MVRPRIWRTARARPPARSTSPPTFRPRSRGPARPSPAPMPSAPKALVPVTDVQVHVTVAGTLAVTLNVPEGVRVQFARFEAAPLTTTRLSVGVTVLTVLVEVITCVIVTVAGLVARTGAARAVCEVESAAGLPGTQASAPPALRFVLVFASVVQVFAVES